MPSRSPSVPWRARQTVWQYRVRTVFVAAARVLKKGPGMSEQARTELTAVLGEVKWFDSRKGYGFIVGPEGQDIFVHYSCIQGDGFRALKDGTQVEYDAQRTDKGWKATRVIRPEPTVEVTDRAPSHARINRH